MLDEARQHCTGPIDVDLLIASAEALLDALAAGEEGEAAPELIAICHEFIDLARLKAVRRAAYPAIEDGPGQRWMALVIRLIEASAFTVGRLFRQRARQYADKTLLVVPRGERVRQYTWQEVAESTERVACGILATLGENPSLALFTDNRIEGAWCDLACLTNGIFNTVVPANSVAAQVEHILNESAARMLVVGGAGRLQVALSALENVPTLEWIVTLDELPKAAGVRMMSLRELMARGGDVSPEALVERSAAVRSGDLATTMYTSGTTGLPKGIKFTQLALVSKRYARAAALPEIDEHEVLVCYLPLYHTFGRWLEMMGCIHLGATYVFAENPSTETLIGHLQRFRPTALISVPKKWRDLQEAAWARLAGQAAGPDGTARDQASDDPEKVRRAVAEVTGGRLRWGLSAAGRLDPTIFRFFHANGVDLLSGYGMTEATGGITMTPPGQYVEESIGLPLPGIEVGLGADNELLLRGPYVTPGYADPAQDATAFADGWFHTGDIVARDERGFLRHVDRKKDVYKNARGRTVAPQRIESLFADFPEITRVCAIGDGREFLTLLIRPNYDCPDVPLLRMTEPERREYFRELVVSCNRFLAPFERVVNFALLDRDFSAAEGELTAKGSFRRAAVVQNFRSVIEPMYASDAIERRVGDLTVRVPIAFLQHLGATEGGTRSLLDGLEFRAIGKTLRVRRDSDRSGRVWIGSGCYEPVDETVDLNDWLRTPELWVGNGDLTHIAGDGIVLWSQIAPDRASPARLVEQMSPMAAMGGFEARLATAMEGAVPSLLTIHGAAVVLGAGTAEAALQAVGHLEHVLEAGLARYVELAEHRLQLAARHRDARVRSQAFLTLYEHQAAERFGETAEVFCGSGQFFLDEAACARLAEFGLKTSHWHALCESLDRLRRRLGRNGGAEDEAEALAIRLLHALGEVGRANPEFFVAVRHEAVAWKLAPVPSSVREVAAAVLTALTAGFREWLGRGSTEAIDPDSRRRYTWGETLQFEDGLDENELGRLANAIQHTPMVREAVYLFYQQKRIDLSDLAPGGIWVSLMGTRFGRSVYHIGLRARSGERYDFAVFARTTADPETFVTGLWLVCLAAEQPGESPLAPQLGGHWAEYGLATVEYVPGESIEALIRHMREHPDLHVRQRLKSAARHLCWSALTAAFEFYRRSGGQWTLTSSVTRDVTVPLEDYDTNTRVRSVAGRCKYDGPLAMLLRLRHEFLERVHFLYPAATRSADDVLLFASVQESLGPAEGRAFLEEAVLEAAGIQKPSPETVQLCAGMQDYLARLAEAGYVPRALHFAIARYRNWSRQV
ncbi:MAG: AMP-binding protein, partial [bacterium]|nr:AMP-binding protein [bacterium]